MSGEQRVQEVDIAARSSAKRVGEETRVVLKGSINSLKSMSLKYSQVYEP